MKKVNDTWSSKASLKDVDTIYQKLTTYASKESFTELFEKVIPAVKVFERDLLKYRDQNLQNREIIRSFDEALMTKAGKIEIKHMEDEIKAKYITIDDFTIYTNDINEILEKHDGNLTELKSMLNILNEEVNKEIFSAVRRATLHLSKSVPIGK